MIVGYKTGDIEDVKDVSIWVNSENTDMMMDRFIGRSVSAKIRTLGANKDDDDNIIDDVVQEGLRDAIGERAHVKIGTVLVTEAGLLRSTHHVRRIFHVAAVQGGLGRGVKADPEELRLCVRNVLVRADKENKKLWRRICKTGMDSILFPMMGAGDAGVPIETVAVNIIRAAIDYLRTTPDATLKEIYFLAFKLRDKSACDNVLEDLCDHKVLERLGS